MDGPDGSKMNGPFRDNMWTDSFKRTDRSTIERRSIVDGPRVDGPKKAMWHSTNNYVVSKKS